MIDAHHHIWLQKDQPWLSGPEQPRIFGSYKAIMRDYNSHEFGEDIRNSGITKSVYVQAHWPHERFEDEVAWVQDEANQHGVVKAVIGYSDFTVEDVRSQLEKLRKYPSMRGLRQQFHWHEKPLYRFAKDPDMCRNLTIQNNVARLADYGWTFDLQVFPSQMAGAVELARACPDVTFILVHSGMREDLSPAGDALWTEGMKKLSDCPNVCSKLSAFGTFLQRNDPDFIEKMITETVGLFGSDRCMFGSNFPIEKLWTSYDELFAAFRNGARNLSQTDQDDIFNNTASRVYRI